MFLRLKDGNKCKCYVFSIYKKRNKVCLLCSECKLQEDGYGWFIFNFKCWKTAERTYLERTKPEAR